MGFIANFMRFPAVQKLWKSVKIWQSYRELKGGNIVYLMVFRIRQTMFHVTFDGKAEVWGEGKLPLPQSRSAPIVYIIEKKRCQPWENKQQSLKNIQNSHYFIITGSIKLSRRQQHSKDWRSYTEAQAGILRETNRKMRRRHYPWSH